MAHPCISPVTLTGFLRRLFSVGDDSTAVRLTLATVIWPQAMIFEKMINLWAHWSFNVEQSPFDWILFLAGRPSPEAAFQPNKRCTLDLFAGQL